MKKILWAILLLPLVAGDAIFSGSVEDDSSFSIGEYNCSVDYKASINKLYFSVGQNGRILVQGECSEIDELRVCFDGINVDDEDFYDEADDDGVGSRSITVDVTAYALVPSVTISRSFSDTSVYLGEEIDIETTISNGGYDTARAMVFTDSFPNAFQLSGADVEGSSVKWNGNIVGENSETIKYKLKSVKLANFTSQASLTYVFEGKSKDVVSSEQLIQVLKPYSVETTISKKSPKQGENIVYNITIENKGEDNLKIEDMLIEPSVNVEIVDYSGFGNYRPLDNKISYGGSIVGGESQTLSITVRSNRVGRHSVRTKATASQGRFDFNEDITDEFGIGVSEIYAIINVTPEVASGEDLKLKVYLLNTGAEKIEDVSVVAQSQLFDDLEALNKDVDADEKLEAISKTIVAPDVDGDKHYTVKVTGSYKKESQTFTFKENAETTIKPGDKIVDVIYELDKDEYAAGDQVNVEVFVLNLENQDLSKVSLIEILPNEIKSSLEGQITADIPLGPKEKKKAYSYSFMIPAVYGSVELKAVVNTRIGDSLKKYEEVRRIEIKSAGLSEPIINQSMNDSAEMSESAEKPEQTFIQKIIDFFLSFFSRSQPEEQE